MINETIAQLTGNLRFNVDTSGFRQFESLFKRMQRQMQELQKQAEQLQSKLNFKTGAAQAASRKSVAASLEREARLEKIVGGAKRDTFAVELARQKLQYTGNKSQASFNSEGLKHKQALAVLSAKEHRASQEGLKAQGIAIKNSATLEAAKARQMRSEKLLAQTQAKTQLLQAKHLQTLTAVQRAELLIQQVREVGYRKAEKFQKDQANATVREQRAAEKHQQSQQRFQWSAGRQQHWEANKGGPVGGSPLAALGTGLASLGAIGAGLASVVAALKVITDRLDKRRDDADEAQQWDLALQQAGGDKKEDQKRAKERFLEITNKYGTSADLEAAKNYKAFMENQRALGLSVDKAADKYETQQASFRGAGLDKEQQKRAAYQLNQIQSKGKPEGGDVNDLFDAAGALAPHIRQAAADRLGFKGSVEKQVGWFKGQITEGNILAKDFDAGMAAYIAKNAAVIEAQQNSINAEHMRSENDKYLQQHNINANADVIASVQERIKAERELTESLQPLREGFASLDILLTKLETSLVRFVTGRNQDGTTKDKNPDAVPVSYPGSAQDQRDMKAMREERIRREAEQAKNSVGGSAAAYGGGEDIPQVNSVLDKLRGANSSQWAPILEGIQKKSQGLNLLPSITIPNFTIPAPRSFPVPAPATPQQTPGGNTPPPQAAPIPPVFQIEDNSQYKFEIVGNPDPKAMVAVLEPEMRRIAEQSQRSAYQGWHTKEVK